MLGTDSVTVCTAAQAGAVARQIEAKARENLFMMDSFQ
jgi:hypothetical protein